ncbi:hypothetical protein GOV06_05780 [Candidatus Woesearchaeota archaeon]|nr:hypothetical protein [Candidatus Woesearchaeota archaeon]
MKLKNLILIGTSHIARQSLKEVTDTIEKEKPDIVAIELDRKRFYALTSQTKRRLRLSDIRAIGIKGFLFSIIGGWIQKKLGKMVGVEPGSEMLAAIKLAKKHKIKLALIDQDIEITLKKISKAWGWKEKLNFLVDLVKGTLFRKSEMKKLGISPKDLDLTKVPPKTLIKKLTKIMKKRYPGLYLVLVEERNKIMANNLKQIMRNSPDKKIVAVVGAGHEDELISLIKAEPKITYSFHIK